VTAVSGATGRKTLEKREFSFETCPVCPWWSIRVVNGKIVRHERGLGYVPYELYRKIERFKPNDPEHTVKAQMKRNLCPASGKTMEEARFLAGFLE